MKVNKSKLFTEFFDQVDDRVVKHLVLHHIAAESFDLAILELKKCQVSSHYIIDSCGEIFQLVAESNVAYHAGVSFWGGQDGLNISSIGIEFYNPKPFELPFSESQIEAGIALCRDIVTRYKIKPENVVGHSDIAYFPNNEENCASGVVGFLGRKQDPGPLFPWHKFYNQGIAKSFDAETIDLLKAVDLGISLSDSKVRDLKNKLSDFGYKIDLCGNTLDPQFLTVIKAVRLHLRWN